MTQGDTENEGRQIIGAKCCQKKCASLSGALSLESALLEYDRPTKADFIWEISAVTATILGDNLNYQSFSIYSCEQYYISPGRVILGRDVRFISN